MSDVNICFRNFSTFNAVLHICDNISGLAQSESNLIVNSLASYSQPEAEIDASREVECH